MRASLAELLAGEEYLSYAYSYPHKTAYRTLDPPVPIREAWAGERRDALFLYLHIPFCEQRCGFCNLYTQARPAAGVQAAYLDAVERQASLVRPALTSQGAPPTFVQYAVGGGTPTWLLPEELARVLRLVRAWTTPGAPGSVEASPATLDDERAAVLIEAGVQRVSLGVQSFEGGETAAVQRLQSPELVAAALRRVAAVPTRNVDLIYGLPGQDAATLRRSIDTAIDLGANELFLYPLYVRPLTGLGRRGWRDPGRLALYRVGRDHLRHRGWVQATMRAFRAPELPSASVAYRCQSDGMVGLGVGARSYTRALHYASPFAVAQGAVREGIQAWIARSDAEHLHAGHGIRLGSEERRRRYLLLTLLEAGLDRAAYLEAFGTDPLADFPELAQAADAGLLVETPGALQLTERGVERADVLGYWLQSLDVHGLRAAWVER